MRLWKRHQGAEGRNIQRQRIPSQKRETTGAVHFVEESTDMKTVKKWLTRVNEEQYYAGTIDILDVFVKVIWPVIVRHALIVVNVRESTIKPGFHIVVSVVSVVSVV